MCEDDGDDGKYFHDFYVDVWMIQLGPAGSVKSIEFGVSSSPRGVVSESSERFHGSIGDFVVGLLGWWMRLAFGI